MGECQYPPLGNCYLLADIAREGIDFLIVGGFYSEVALRNERQRAQCILSKTGTRRVCVFITGESESQNKERIF